MFFLCSDMELIKSYSSIINLIVLLETQSQTLDAARTRFCNNTRLFLELAGFFNNTLDCLPWRRPISITNKPSIMRLGLNTFAPFLASLFYSGRICRIAIEILSIHISGLCILHYSVLEISLLLLLFSKPHHEDFLLHP